MVVKVYLRPGKRRIGRLRARRSDDLRKMVGWSWMLAAKDRFRCRAIGEAYVQ